MPVWLRTLALLLVALGGGAAHAQLRPQASEVEAAYLINFLRYTQWPPQSFDGAQAPFVLSVVGSEAVAASVRAVAHAAGPINGHPIDVRWVGGGLHGDAAQRKSAQTSLAASHLVFFHASAGGVRAEDLAALAGKPVLTVGDEPGFSAGGGMIELFGAGGHIVFAANPAAIRAAGLMVSAKVLKLARASTGGTP